MIDIKRIFNLLNVHIYKVNCTQNVVRRTEAMKRIEIPTNNLSFKTNVTYNYFILKKIEYVPNSTAFKM